MADACAKKPKPPVPGPSSDPAKWGVGAAEAKAAVFDFDGCAAEITMFKAVCQDGYAKIDAEVKAKTITPTEAAKKFAEVAAQCKAEGAKVATACNTPK